MVLLPKAWQCLPVSGGQLFVDRSRGQDGPPPGGYDPGALVAQLEGTCPLQGAGASGLSFPRRQWGWVEARNGQGCGSGVPPVGDRARPWGPCVCARRPAPWSPRLASRARRLDLDCRLGASAHSAAPCLMSQPYSRQGLCSGNLGEEGRHHHLQEGLLDGNQCCSPEALLGSPMETRESAHGRETGVGSSQACSITHDHPPWESEGPGGAWSQAAQAHTRFNAPSLPS